MTLRLSQSANEDGSHRVEAMVSGDRVRQQAVARVDFAMSDADRERVRWYLEDFLEYPVDPAPKVAAGVEARLRELGEQLFTAMFGADDGMRLWARLQERLPDTRVEIASEVGDATAVPWELLRDPATGTAVALEAASFVRVNQQPARPVRLDPSNAGRLRVLLVICRPKAGADVPFRSVASALVRLGDEARQVFDLDVLRPPTFAALTRVLEKAKRAGRPYHVVHFDGHGTYLDPIGAVGDESTAGDSGGYSPHRYRVNLVSPPRRGKRGYLVFEDPEDDDNEQLVDGPTLGDLLARTGVSVLVLNACRSAYAEAPPKPVGAAEGSASTAGAEADVHARVRAYGSLALEVTDAGVPGVVAMRYSVYVVTAAQFVADLYAGLLAGQPLGAAVTEGRRQLAAQPNRRIAFDPLPLQDWTVPIVYETEPLALFTTATDGQVTVHVDQPGDYAADETGLPHRPDVGFFGRDETLLALDRAFDTHPVVLLHAFAGAGKTSTAVEFARWYAATGGLTDSRAGNGPVIFSSLEQHTPLARLLNQLAEEFTPLREADGVHWAALNDTDRRKAALRLFAQVPVLWIWDNVEPVAGFPTGTPSAWTDAEQTELADFLRDLTRTRARVLLTSRRDEQAWLGDVPVRVELPPMPMRERIQLTQALAKRHGHRITDVADWRPLLRYTAGNPLTITVLVGQALRDRLTSDRQIEDFVRKLRAGETPLADDETYGRSKSLSASLNFGFTHAFTESERARLALLHLFQDTVDVDVLVLMGQPENPAAVPALAGLTRDTGIALLDRAAEIGLLTRIGTGYYSIHPALPWYFTHLFVTHHGAPDSASAVQATHAYTTAIAHVGNYYHSEYEEGRHQVIGNLAVEEANLLHARTLARQHRRWGAVVGCMQSLRSLYEHLGRGGEWARLVNELIPDMVDPTTDRPLPGREEQWSVFTDYLVSLARERRDWASAERLQIARVAWDRELAAASLGTAPDQLDGAQRNDVRNLAVSLQGLGNILRVRQQADCVTSYKEAAYLLQRIGDRRGEGVIAFNLGSAYLNIAELRDLDEAERWYRRDLELTDERDQLGRAGTISQLGKVAHERFYQARDAGAPPEELVEHLEAAAATYHQALDLTPADHLNNRAVNHAVLGSIYSNAGKIDNALTHYYKAIRNYEDIGDRYWAGRIRLNAAIALGRAGRAEEALLYARAAIPDFDSYGAAAIEDIEEAQTLIAYIEQERR